MQGDNACVLLLLYVCVGVCNQIVCVTGACVSVCVGTLHVQLFMHTC